ncbi:uncharacterized protein LOC119358148 [Triticum dicoccoides]|uniref:uncharacterized protein LOC119358148 n=1 Tax=Triticum dicoccoides TaxID=85692 RepID=UPI00188F510C|nr:uncharacterized protein LOC119358148 [Triticum dicoccoides]
MCPAPTSPSPTPAPTSPRAAWPDLAVAHAEHPAPTSPPLTYTGVSGFSTLLPLSVQPFLAEKKEKHYQFAQETTPSISMEIYGDLEAGCLSHSVSPIKPASPPRKAGPGRLFCDPCDDADQLLGHHHYLDICFSCRKLLAGNKDIFMYRGDTPFCSEECRQEQIEIDEAREKRSSQTGRAEEQRQRQQQKQSTPRIPVWAW